MGQGEIPCAIDINGELAESAANLVPYITHALQNADLDAITSPEDIQGIMEHIDLMIAQNAATKCGVEQALFDILSQKTGKALADTFGRERDTVKIQGNIPYLKDMDAYEKEIAHILSKGPEYMKFKIGKDLKLEAEAIRRARTMSGSVGLTVDANQAFASGEDALTFLSSIENARLAWAEQLVGKHDIAGWKTLAGGTDVPLMADESVQSVLDVLLFLQNEWIDIVNLKIGKCGGVLEARKIVRLARQFGVPVMLGSMLEGELGTRYNLAFALSESFITHDFYHYFSLEAVPEHPLIDPETFATTEAILL